MKLLYWDIDGTLVNTGMAGMHAIHEVFHQLQGNDQAVPKIAAGGRTDNYICQQLLYQARGVMPGDEEVDAFCRQYERQLMKWLKKMNGEVIPPARELLPFFAKRADVRQCLLTGNSIYGARMKLEFFNLSQYFDFDHSGFACQFYYRNEMARHAYELAKEAWGDDIGTMYVIGDTPYDIQCGKAIGARTISVSTGHYSYEELKKHEPWRLVHQLPGPQEFLAMLEEE